jgi:signal transduction histidine kinase
MSRKVTPLALLLVTAPDTDIGGVLGELELAGFQINSRRVTNPEQLRGFWSEGGWQVVLADERLDGWSGLEALELVRTIDPNVARVLRSVSLENVDVAAASCRPGGPDLLPSGLPSLVGPVVVRALERSTLRRTVERCESELLRTRRLDSLGSLAGALVHELNNLLTPMVFSGEVLFELAGDGAHRELLEALTTGSRRAADAVKRLQNFIHGEQAEWREIRPAELLGELEKLWQLSLPKSVRRRVHAHDQLWEIRGEPALLMQIFVSLTANALDAMPRGGQLTLKGENVELETTMLVGGRELTPGSYVRFEMVDSGEGMTTDVVLRAGEPFFTTKEPGRHLGLGLAASHEIASRHGGGIEVESTPGQGTCVAVHFPAAKQFPAPPPAVETGGGAE